jgi:anti-sigma factor RsiW
VIDSYKGSESVGGSVDFATYHAAAVEAWLHDRIALAAPIRDVPAGTVTLNGARTEKLGSQSAAVLVYRTRAAEIDLFVCPDVMAHGGEPMTDQVGVYTVSRWSTAGEQYWAVTETHDKSVGDLRWLVQWLSAPPAP